jgi:hypothetical protein
VPGASGQVGIAFDDELDCDVARRVPEVECDAVAAVEHRWNRQARHGNQPGIRILGDDTVVIVNGRRKR